VSAALLTISPAPAQDQTFNLKISSWSPTTIPLFASFNEWAASMTAASKNTLRFTVFPSEQLGKAFDHYDMARDGIADFTYANPGYQPGRFPIIDAAALPFMFNNKNGIAAVDAWYRKYAGSEMKDVKFCFAFIHDLGSFHSRPKKIVVPSDISGMKVRPAHAMMANFVTSLGGVNVQASAPEVRDVIAKGIADAVTFPWGSIVAFGIDRVTKYHMEAGLYTTPFVVVMNKTRYEGLAATQRAVVDDHCTTEWAMRFASPWADYEHDGISQIKALPGHEVYPLTDEQLAQWRQAAEPLIGQWINNVKKINQDGEIILRDLKENISKYHAGS
jgi:TRAP-type C4-dicarboxylate transport system substrate-binding protein